MGYLRRDGRWFVERGAPMTDGGTAWLLWRVAAPAEYETDEFGSYTLLGGRPLRTLDELTMSEVPGTSLFIHVNDAGSLWEAKSTIARHEERPVTPA